MHMCPGALRGRGWFRRVSGALVQSEGPRGLEALSGQIMCRCGRRYSQTGALAKQAFGDIPGMLAAVLPTSLTYIASSSALMPIALTV